jgi:hypothetical protein
MTTLVGIGTLALAVAAFLNLYTSDTATRESYKSRIDQGSQKVTLKNLTVGTNIWTKPNIGNPQAVPLGTGFDLVKEGGELLRVTARLALHNEGEHTAFLKLTEESSEDLRWTIANLGRDIASGQSPNGADFQEGWALVPGRHIANLELQWTRSVEDWWRDALVTEHSGAVPRVSFVVMVRDAWGNAEDRYKCAFGRPCLMRKSGSDDVVIFAPLSATLGLPNVENVGLAARTYPKIPTLPFIARYLFPHHRKWQ